MEKGNDKYCYFIISCLKNELVMRLLVHSLKSAIMTNTKIYVSMDGCFDKKVADNVFIISDTKSRCFGDRIKDALEKINFRHVIVLCDDFIVERFVNEEELSKLLDCFKETPYITGIALAQISGMNEKEFLNIPEYPYKYVKRTRFSLFKTTLQCSIWDKNALCKLMSGVRSPWEFEIFSNYRTFTSCNSFYALINDNEQPIRYNRGRFIIRGKMVEPEKKRLEDILGYKINIDDYVMTDSYIQNDNMAVAEKIKRRIKMMVYDLFYRLTSLLSIKRDDLNN